MAGGAGRGAGGGMKEAPTEAGAEVDGDSLNTDNLFDLDTVHLAGPAAWGQRQTATLH